jgi:hypothetical protein
MRPVHRARPDDDMVTAQGFRPISRSIQDGVLSEQVVDGAGDLHPATIEHDHLIAGPFEVTNDV